MRMKTNWLEIKERFITGNVSHKELANEFGLSEKTIMNRSSKENWKEQKENYRKKVGEKIEEKTSEYKAQAYENIMKKACGAENLIVEKAINLVKDAQLEEKQDSQYVHKCQKIIESAVATMERVRFPQKEEETKDNNITVVLDDSLKEYFN